MLDEDKHHPQGFAQCGSPKPVLIAGLLLPYKTFMNDLLTTNKAIGYNLKNN